VQTCIRFLDAGVGGAVQLWTMESTACAPVSGEDLEYVEHGVEQWTLIEKESLDDVLGDQRPDPAEAEAAELPKSLGPGE
jgi:hypothetical protein